MYEDIWNDKPVRIRRSLTSTVCGVCREPGCQPYDGNIARWYILLGFDWGGLRCPILCVGSDRLFILWYPDFGQQKSNRMRYTAFFAYKNRIWHRVTREDCPCGQTLWWGNPVGVRSCPRICMRRSLSFMAWAGHWGWNPEKAKWQTQEQKCIPNAWARRPAMIECGCAVRRVIKLTRKKTDVSGKKHYLTRPFYILLSKWRNENEKKSAIMCACSHNAVQHGSCASAWRNDAGFVRSHDA